MSKAPPELVAILADIRLPRRERQIADVLLAQYPRFASKSLLCGRVFDDEREETEWPGETVQSHISKLRTKLIGAGWSIENSRYVGYRFVRVEAGIQRNHPAVVIASPAMETKQ
jgi:DNA-binding response OmpR family regulator